MAKGPGAAKSVGKVSVRVVPDTSKFREELAVQLKKEMAGFSVKVPVKVDTKQLGTVKKIIGETSNDLTKLDFSKAFNFDMTPFEHAIGRVLVQIQRMQDGLKAVVTRSKQMLASFRDSVNVVGRMRQYWKGVREEAGSTGRTVSRVLSVRAFKSIIGGVQSLGRGFRTLGVQARRGLGAIPGMLASVGGGMSSMASSATSLLAALIPTSRAGLIFFAVLAGGAPILGLVAGLLAGLPSLAFAFAAPIAAIALGFEGIKNAASVLSDEVDHLKKSVSATFEKGMAPVFKQMEQIFPVLERGLNSVAEGTISWAAAFTDVITSAKGSAQLETILTNVGSLFQQMTPFVTNFTDAFLTMAEAGSNQFSLLATVMNDFAASFNAMIQRSVANGTFAAAIEGLAKVTSALLQVFVQLFEAGLKAMAQVGGPLAGLITAFGNALVAVVPILGAITNLVATVLTPVLNALASVFQILAPVITQIATLIGNFLAGAFQTIMPVLTQLAQVIATVLLTAMQALAPVFDALVEAFASIATGLGPILADLFAALGRLMESLAPVITELGLIIVDVLVQAFEILQPVLELVVDFIADLFDALKPVMPEISKLAKAIGQLLIGVLKALMPIITALAETVLPAIVAVVQKAIPFITKIVQVFTQLVTPIINVVTALVQKLMPAFQGLFNAVKPIMEGILSIIQGVFDVIIGIFKVFSGILTGNWQAAWEGLKQIFSGIWNGILGGIVSALEGLWELIKSIPGVLWDLFSGAVDWLWDAGVAIITGLWDGIKWLAGQVWEWMGGIKDTVLGFFEGVGRWLWDAGKNLVQGLWDGWKAYFDDFESAVVDDANNMIDNINGIFGIFSPSRVFRQIGEYIGQGLILGVQSQSLGVMRSAENMANQVINGFGTPDVSVDWVAGVENNMPAALSAVQDMAQQMNKTAQAEFSGQLSADDQFTSVADQIADAMRNVEIKMDGKPVGKIVNKNNIANRRRG